MGRLLPKGTIAAIALVLAIAPTASAHQSEEGEPLDPARGEPLPCEVVSTPGAVPRSAHGIVHLAGVCGFVGTDIEFQSRVDSTGAVRDFAFVGTMGAGMRIFDITDPLHPTFAGGYLDSGWQNDVQVRGDLAVIAFDPISSVPAPTASACLRSKSLTGGGTDIVRLEFDPATATFETSLLDCVPNPPGGTHNSTLNPNGQWLAQLAPITNGYVDVVDLRSGSPVHRYRIIGTAASSRCPEGASFTCIATGRDWSPHDLHFSRDGNTIYVAAVRSDTLIVDVSRVLSGRATILGVVPNFSESGGLANSRNIDISHQSDVSADGKILVISDERGGGLSNTACNTDPNGVIGGLHFWALGPVDGMKKTANASPSRPVKLGSWFYPNPTLAVDPLEPALAMLPRTERACTIHVFRLGGNGSSSPGAAFSGMDGVSGLPIRELVSAHYGAGVWYIDFSKPARDTGLPEDPHSTWGNTLGWNVMPGAETWSVKEYKGFIYAGDMLRGFDVYGFADCDGTACVAAP